ncbi:MAG TPA: hypothetical protein VFA20_11440 [Myxococcaceae bacterium]|nr:hypothetical protein [Myxococcaceae bacterium]
MGRRDRAPFEPAFEGKEVLDGLLDIAGARVDTEGAVVRMREALRHGEPRETVVPTLFDGEPHFPDPDVARRLFQNLLGLWDVLARGQSISLDEGPGRARPAKKPIPERPPPFEGDAPDDAWMEAAWKYLDEAPEREVTRLEHSFENRQDALLGFLDEQGLPDEVFGLARQLLFELHALIELGWPPGVRSLARAELQEAGTGHPAPAALQAYADEAVFEAEQDEVAPLTPADSARAKALVTQGLRALWSARRPRKESSTDA